MHCEGGVRFFTETPGMHLSCGVQAFIEQEIQKPSKVWAQEVVESKREMDTVKLRTDDFVLLPDINASRRHFRWSYARSTTAGCVGPPRHPHHQRPMPRWTKPAAQCAPEAREAPGAPRGFNWLAIVTDPDMRTIRDLRGEHVEMLERLYEQCVEAIKREYKVERHDIMVFANYPPSVYKLHFHFCAPFFTSSAYDAFRMHSLSGIINNLRLFSDYYKLSSFQVPIHVGSELFRIAESCSDEQQEEKQDTAFF